MTFTRFALFVLAFALSPKWSLAHPGHGTPESDASVIHYVSSPMHLLPILLVALIVGAMSLYAYRLRVRVATAATRTSR